MTNVVINAHSSNETVRSEGVGYVAARNGTYNTGVLGDTYIWVGQQHDGSATPYECYETFERFDIQGNIPSGSLITDVTLTIHVSSKQTGGSDFFVQARPYDWGDSVTAGDYVAGNTLNGITLLASRSTSLMGAGSDEDLTNNGTELKDFVQAVLDGTDGYGADGWLRYLLCGSRTADGDAPSPSTNEFVKLSQSSNSKLSIDYVTGGNHLMNLGTVF